MDVNPLQLTSGATGDQTGSESGTTMKKTTIQVDVPVREAINGLKIGGETQNDVLKKLLRHWRENPPKVVEKVTITPRKPIAG
jgi:hypothetical protein